MDIRSLLCRGVVLTGLSFLVCHGGPAPASAAGMQPGPVRTVDCDRLERASRAAMDAFSRRCLRFPVALCPAFRADVVWPGVESIYRRRITLEEIRRSRSIGQIRALERPYARFIRFCGLHERDCDAFRRAVVPAARQFLTRYAIFVERCT